MSYSDLKQKLYADIGVPTGDGNQNASAVSGYENVRNSLYQEIGYKPPDRDALNRNSYINKFLNDADGFFRSVDSDINGENRFDAADFFAQRQKQAESLRNQASIVSQYLDQYGDSYSQKDYDFLREYLSTFNTNVDEVMGYYQPSIDARTGMAAYEDEYKAYLEQQQKKQAIWDSFTPDMSNPAYGIMNLFRPEVGQDGQGITEQWTDEQRYILGTLQNEDPREARKYARNVNKGQDPYQIAAANEQEEQELLALDLTAAQRELDELNAQYDNYQYDASTFRGRMAAEADLKRMEQEISQKQQIINKARHLQEGVQMASVTGNSDFGEKSGYVSTEYSPNVRFDDYRLDYKDPVYEYINNTPGVRDQVSATNKPLANKGYDLMTEEEVANYNYHYATGGKEQAQRYLDTIAETLSDRKAQQIFQNLKGNTLRELAFSAGVGLNQASENLQNLFSGDDYIAPSAYQIAGGMVREDLADVGPQLPEWMGGSSLGQVGYDLINTAANMAPSMAIGAINPIAGTLTMGASAAGGAYQEALNEGYSKQQARTYSALVGASEAGLEYLMGGISSLGGLIPGGIVEKMLDGVDNAFKRFAIEMGGSVIGEGFEEGLQEVLTPYFQNLAMNTDKDVNWNEVAYSALLGALSGGVMEAPGTAANAVSYSLRNRPGTGSSSAPSTPALTENDIKAKVTEDGRSRIVSTNESVDANDFASIKNGDASILLSNGNTAPMDDVNFASTEEAARFMTIKSLPGIETEAANDLYHAMKDNNAGSDTDTIVGVRDAYALGYYGFQKSDTTKNGTDAAKLSPALRTAAFEAGQKQRSMNAAVAPKVSTPSTAVKPAAGYQRVVFEGKPKLDKKTRAEVHFMDFVAEKFSGTTVHVYQSFKGKGGKYYYRDTHGKIVEAPNGRYVNDEIWIDLNSGDKGEGLALNTFAHEMYHHVEKWNQKGAQKLAEFVVKELGMADVKSAVNDQIKKAEAAGYGVEHFMKYGNNGKGMTREQAINYVEQRAMSDFVADSLETMFSRGDAAEVITRLKEEDRGLFDKIKEFVDQWVSTLKQWYSDKTISQEGKKVAQLERFEELQKLFLEAVSEAGENYNAAIGTAETLTPGKEGVVVNENGDPVAMSTDDGTMMLSIRTYEEEGRSLFRKYLDKCVTSKRLTREEAKEMRDSIEEIYQVCKDFKDKYVPFSKWSDAEVIRDTHGKPVFSVVTPNGEYKMNLDFSLVCRKRRTLDAVFNEMTKRGIIDDFELGQKTVVKINEIIRKFQFETACSLCFVDARRFRQADVADSFVNLYNDLVQSLVPENRQGEISRFNFGGVQGIESGDGITKIPNDQLDFSHINDVLKRYESGTVEYKAAKYIKANPNGRKLLMRGDFMSSKGFDAVKSQNEDIMKLYNSKKGTGGPKAAFGDVQYLNEVIKKARWWTPKKAYEVGGVRIQSFSDYVPRMVFDYVQMIHDLAANKLPAHAYTKEALFVQQFGMTGVKINMSLIPAIAEGGIAAGLDKNGNYVWAGESFDFETAKAIQNAAEYTENCGTICVGVSYQHIVKLLGDPNIRMVIPYHKSGLNPIVAHMNKIAEFTDYSTLKTNPGGCQSTMDSNGQKVENDFNFNEDLRKTGDPKKTAQNYLAWCHDPKRNYTPKFAEFEWHENYYKLLIDFTVYDKDGNYVPQRGVKAVFPKDGNTFGSMKDLIRSGLEEDAEIEGRRNRDLPKIVDEILKVIPRTEAEISENAVEQADRDLEATDILQKSIDNDATRIENGSRGDANDNQRIRKGTQGKTESSQNDRSAGTKSSGNAQKATEWRSLDRRSQKKVRDIVSGRISSSSNTNEILSIMYSEIGETEDTITGSSYKKALDVFSGKVFAAAMEMHPVLFENAYSYFSNSLTGFQKEIKSVIGDDGQYSLRNAPENIHDVRRRIAAGMDDAANTGNLKKWAGEYREKIAQAEAIESNLKIKDQQIQELESAKNPKDKQKFYALRREVNQMREDLGNLNKRIQYIESLKAFRDISAGENAAYSKSLLQQMRNQQAENIQQQLLENRIVREELTGKDSDITIMEKEFIRIVKKYEQLDAKTGKKITDLRNALKAEADSHKAESRLWQREFNRLLREYETSGRKIERLEATIARQRATAKARVQSRRNTEMRNKIQRRAGELDRMLRNGTKTSYVPEGLREPVAAILEAIDLRKSDKETKVAQHLKDLRLAYYDIRSNSDPNIRSIFDEGLSDHLETLTKEVGDTKLGDMTPRQLEAVHDILTAVLETVRNANEAFAESKKAKISEMSDAAMRQIRSAGKEKYRGKMDSDFVKGLKAFMWNDMRPVDIFEAIGSGEMMNLFRNIRKGEDVWAKDIQEARDFFRQQWQKNKGDDWDMNQQHTFTSASGMDFQLSLDQIMSIYALFRRDKDQAMAHLRQGGFVFDNNVVDKNGKSHTDATAYNLTDDTILNIIGKLNADQMAFVESMQGYLSDTMGAKGNEVSMKLYGIKLFREKNYFPIRSAEQYMERAKAQQRGEVKIKNSGFTKPVTPNANTPIVLSSFMDVWGSHVDEMSNYHAFVLPMEDMYRVYNYRTDISNEESASRSVQAAIQNAYGEGAVKAIDQLLKDINGGVRSDSTAGFLNKLISRYKKGATMASLSVAVQQPSAIMRAAAMIDWKYFVGPKPTAKMTGRTWDEIKKHAPIAIIKEIGGFDTNTGRAASEFLTKMEYQGFEEQFKAFFKDGQFRDDVLGRLPAWADEISWGVIWNAAKREQKSQHPNMDVTSDAFLNKVAERFTDVIVHTQVYDSVLAKNAMMRSKDTGMKMVTSFMAEPTVTANMMASAITKAIRKGDKAGARKTISAVVASTLFNAAASSVVYALRDDDEDERYGEKWIASFRENLLESANPMGYIPLLRDVNNILAGYDIERADMSIVSDFTEAVKSLDNEDMSDWEKVEKFAGAVANIFGVPLKNVTRDLKGVWNTLRTGFGAKNAATKTGAYMAATGKNLSDGEQLLLAIQRGDEKHWTRVAERYDSLEDAVGALKTAIGSHYKDGSMTEAEATELLTTYGDMDEDEIYWKMQEWNHGKAKGNTENYSKFGALHQAIESGEGVEAEIDRYREHGTEEATIRSDISRVYKKDYLSAAEEDREAIRQKITPAYVYTGMRDDEIEDKFKDWDFEAKYGMSYSEYKAGYLDDSVSRFELEDAMKFYGLKNYQISETVRSMDKDKKFRDRFGMSLTQMKDGYDDGDVSRNQLINALVYNGMTQKEASQEVTQRDIRNRLGIDYSELDDAYKHGDITRQTLYNAMTENGATKQEADESIQSYDWLKKHVKQYPDLTVSDGKKFSVSLGDNAEGYTLEDFGVSIDIYIEYKQKLPECQGVDANGDGKTDSGTKRDAIFRMIDSLPISDEAKDGLALMSYSKNSIKKNAPWH